MAGKDEKKDKGKEKAEKVEKEKKEKEKKAKKEKPEQPKAEKPIKPEKPKKAPKEPKSPRRFLRPLVPFYRLALKLREHRLNSGAETIDHLRWPVISIGNISTGGTGKTPFAIALAKAMTQRGFPVDVLSRGFGRNSVETLRVSVGGTVADFGDEPLVILREAEVPVFVAPHRFDAGQMAEKLLEPEILATREREAQEKAALEAEEKAAQEAERQLLLAEGIDEAALDAAYALERAEKEKAQAFSLALVKTTGPKRVENLPPVHLLDDGFQHRQLARAIDILLFNRQDWQDGLLPAGNLREPHYAAHRATVIAIPADDQPLEEALRLWGWEGPIWKFRRIMQVEDPAKSAEAKHKEEEEEQIHPRGVHHELGHKKDQHEHGEAPFTTPVAAFCGIARPEQFFQGLKNLKLQLVGEYSYGDHYTYPDEILKEMVHVAVEAGATAMITTAKDYARLGKQVNFFPKTLPLVVAQLKVEIDDIETILDWMTDQLMSRPERAQN